MLSNGTHIHLRNRGTGKCFQMGRTSILEIGELGSAFKWDGKLQVIIESRFSVSDYIIIYFTLFFSFLYNIHPYHAANGF